MKVGRGAQRAISSWASTGRSFGGSGPPYLRKFPAIQWYSPEPVRFSTSSPKLRRCRSRPPRARGADEADGEGRVIRHCNERRLAVAREPFDADLLGVDG